MGVRGPSPHYRLTRRGLGGSARQNAMEPHIHGVRTHWNRGFMALRRRADERARAS